MLDLLIFCLATSGATYIFTQSFLFKKFRDLFYIGPEFYAEYCKMITCPGHKVCKEFSTPKRHISFYIYELVTCPLCSGFWIGLIMYQVVFEWKIDWIIYGSISAIAAFFAFQVIDLIWTVRKILKGDLPLPEYTTSGKTFSSEQ